MSSNGHHTPAGKAPAVSLKGGGHMTTTISPAAIADIEADDGNHHWATQIPQKAVGVFKEFGYDGIKDFSGKYNDKAHRFTVWIAFDSEQVKGVCVSWLNLNELPIHRLCLAKHTLLVQCNGLIEPGLSLCSCR